MKAYNMKTFINNDISYRLIYKVKKRKNLKYNNLVCKKILV